MKSLRLVFLWIGFCGSWLCAYEAIAVNGITSACIYPKVVINESNQSMIVWNRKHGGIQYAFYNSQNMQYSAAVTLSEKGGDCQLAINNAGVALIGWIQEEDVWYVQVDMNSKQIGTIHRFGLSPNSPVNLNLTLNDQNQAIIAWNTGGSVLGGQIVYSLFNHTTGYFGSTTTLGNVSDGDFAPKVKINASGFAMMMWNTNGSHGGDVNFTIKNAGDTTFGAIQTLPTRTGSGNFVPIMALNKQGTAISGWDSVVAGSGSNIFPTFYLDYGVYPSFNTFSTLNTLDGIRVFADIALNDLNEGIITFLVIQLHIDLNTLEHNKNINKSDVVQSFVGYAIYNSSTGSFDTPHILPGTGKVSYLPMIALNQNGTGFISWNTGGSDLGGDIQFSFYDKKNRNFSQIFTVSGSTFANSSPTVNTKNMGVIAFNSGADKGGGIYYILLNPLSSLIQNSQGRIFLQRGYPL